MAVGIWGGARTGRVRTGGGWDLSTEWRRQLGSGKGPGLGGPGLGGGGGWGLGTGWRRRLGSGDWMAAAAVGVWEGARTGGSRTGWRRRLGSGEGPGLGGGGGWAEPGGQLGGSGSRHIDCPCLVPGAAGRNCISSVTAPPPTTKYNYHVVVLSF